LTGSPSPTGDGVRFLPGMETLVFVELGLFFAAGLLQLVYAIVGTVQASRGRRVRLPVIPFLRAPRNCPTVHRDKPRQPGGPGSAGRFPAEVTTLPITVTVPGGRFSPVLAQGRNWRDVLTAHGAEGHWTELSGEAHEFSAPALGRLPGRPAAS